MTYSDDQPAGPPQDGPWGAAPKASSLHSPIKNLGAPRPRRTTEKPSYIGKRGAIFKLSFLYMLLTIITVGIARFWMITRIRKHYWSSLQIGGAPLEYTGRPTEKLIGFLIALAILAVYLVVVNLGLSFVGLAFFQGNPLALQLPLLALIPFWPWAMYRARRYLMARTRWRGIRFGLENGAWGYTRRYLLWWLATIFSFGLLYPLMQLRLSQFTTARSYYGDLQFEQRGKLWPLMRVWLWTFAPLAVMVVGGIGIAITLAANGGEATDLTAAFTGIFTLAGVVFYFWVFIAFFVYSVHSFRYLNSNKVLANRTRCDFEIGGWTVFGIYLGGGLLLYIGAAVFAGVGLLISYILVTLSGVDAEGGAQLAMGEWPTYDSIGALVMVIGPYLLTIAGFVALSQAFITHPLLAAVTRTTFIHDLAGADRARQREHDEQAEAGGFADALGADVGGAF